MPAPRRIDHERITDVALEIVDAEGLDALTMRRVASALDVEAMSLYHHVASKDALLDAVLGRLLASVRLPAKDAPWQEQLRALARNMRKVALRHPEAFRLVATRPVRSSDALAFFERVFVELARAGLPPTDAMEAFKLLAGMTVGLLQLELTGFFAGEKPERAVDAAGDEYPHVQAVAALGHRYHASRHFDQALDVVIGGIENIARTRAAGTAPAK
jgi:TetR/AcrR family tetracycline transcriptional repressor